MPDRELGGYTNANAVPGGGPSVREIDVIISPAAGTIAQWVEQTFTVPGVLASDRLLGFTLTSQAPAAAGTSLNIFPSNGRVSAISIVSIGYFNGATAAATPTTSAQYAFFIAAQRAIP